MAKPVTLEGYTDQHPVDCEGVSLQIACSTFNNSLYRSSQKLPMSWSFRDAARRDPQFSG